MAYSTTARIWWVSFMALYSAVFLGTKSGSWKKLNQLTGKPRAEVIIQPVRGMANSTRYKPKCVIVARVRSYGFRVVGSAGVGLAQRHNRRMTARARIVMPTDLCRAYMASFLMPI